MTRTFSKTICLVLAAAAMSAASKAQAGLVWFSRANCINNESISWDWPGKVYRLHTSSHHWNSRTGWEKPIHTGWESSNHSGAIHWGEGLKGGYYVIGVHHSWNSHYGEIFLGYTPATHCSIGFFFPGW
ncbi:hypothetical protein KY495_10655 [Massilia sp. PAMC28688]|uniref:hypothetical protein n=1 Tax=Massilia sp. PAMC28688 TaxID=2861283 RepID=UPI001C635625|nr:hypothetical protein [Massilia sp. PAMC28688]QYF95561.1 hypothetical protein KY495_10655 [Massilia sp. PAMC28688]